MNPKVDVLIVTVNEHETKAVHEVFNQATGELRDPIPIDGRVYQDLGEIRNTRIFHAISGQGSGSPGAMQQTVDKAIRALHPDAVIAVGIAFGMNEKKQAIGDILVSKQLRLYDLGRHGAAIILRGDKPGASPRLINFFEIAARRSWTGSKVRPGVILTGEKLVDSLDYRDQLQRFEPEAVGGEMEGAGLYVACNEHKVDWIVIKAICDWADGAKSKNKEARQKKAALSAVTFLMHALGTATLATGPQPMLSKTDDTTSLHPSAVLQPSPPNSSPANEYSVLFLDWRNSSLLCADPQISSDGFTEIMLWLYDQASILLENHALTNITCVKPLGDGLMVVFQTSTRRADILRFALTALERLPALAAARFPHATCEIGIGLAFGRVRAVGTSGVDYLGFTLNLASKLQACARPGGLVVDASFFEGPDATEARNVATGVLTRHELHLESMKYDARVWVDRQVQLPTKWTCLAWPGFAAPTPRPVANTRIPLNHRGFMVLTHEGLQGKLDTLEVWPRNVTVTKGDRFEIIIDDFDTLWRLHAEQSIRLAQPSRRVWSQTDFSNFLESRGVSQPIRDIALSAPFLFIPIRCGINAIAVRQDVNLPADVGSYEEFFGHLRPRLVSGELTVAIYDNMGGTLPVLLRCFGLPEPQQAAFNASPDHKNSLLDALALLQKDIGVHRRPFRLYSEISALRAALWTNRIHVVLGGGAWLAKSTADYGPCFVTCIVPQAQESAYLWLEGAAFPTRDDSYPQDLKSVARLLADAVLSNDSQEMLATVDPYPCCPVCADSISRALRDASVKPEILMETKRLFVDGHRKKSAIIPRGKFSHAGTWSQAWVELKSGFTELANA